jgi:hypothetical protein
MYNAEGKGRLANEPIGCKNGRRPSIQWSEADGVPFLTVLLCGYSLITNIYIFNYGIRRTAYYAQLCIVKN